jgi:hypothetical protein
MIAGFEGKWSPLKNEIITMVDSLRSEREYAIKRSRNEDIQKTPKSCEQWEFGLKKTILGPGFRPNPRKRISSSTFGHFGGGRGWREWEDFPTKNQMFIPSKEIDAPPKGIWAASRITLHIHSMYSCSFPLRGNGKFWWGLEGGVEDEWPIRLRWKGGWMIPPEWNRLQMGIHNEQLGRMTKKGRTHFGDQSN